MPASNDVSNIEAFVLSATGELDRQHKLLSGVVALFVEMTVAMDPVLKACGDPAVLTKASQDLRRLNTEIIKLAKEGGLKL